MSMFPEPPFDDREERYMLAEILKDSPISPGNLLRVIQVEGIQPRWTEIALPHGRSVSACQKAFDSLYSRVFQIHLQNLPPAPQTSPPTKGKKRPVPGVETPTGLNRELQPRNPGFAIVNEPTESTAYPTSLIDSAEQHRKKRGRPTKAELEIKAAEYAARGQPYPPPRRPKNPKISAEGAAAVGPSITFTPVTMGPSGTEASASGKKRVSKAKVQTDDAVAVYGPAAPPVHQLHQEVAVSHESPDPAFQAPRPQPPETNLPGIASIAQDQTRQGSRVSHSSPQENVRMNPLEGSPGHDGHGPSSERTHDAGIVALQTSGPADPQTVVQQASPSVMPAPEQE